MAGLLCKPKGCTSCGVALPLVRSRRQKWCPTCSVREQAKNGRARMMERYRADPEARREERRRYREGHRPHLRLYQKAYEERTGNTARWRREHPEQVREMNRRCQKTRDKDKQHSCQLTRRAQKQNAFVERVFRSVLWRRHGGLCGICNEPVAITAMHVDHVIPLARGGEHSYANTQPSHPRCNARKGAKLPMEMNSANAA